MDYALLIKLIIGSSLTASLLVILIIAVKLAFGRIISATWEIPKGSGRMTFNIPVTPKKWIETPFKISAEMVDVDTKIVLGGYRCNMPVW